MRALRCAVVVLAGLGPLSVPLLTPAGPAQDGTREKTSAWRLEVEESWVKKVEIETMESAPPQFAVVLTVPVPDPGWKLEVDEVAAPDAAGRIRVRVSGEAGEGVFPQVITDRTVRVFLGRVQAGPHVLEVHYRADAAAGYRHRATVFLQGHGR